MLLQLYRDPEIVRQVVEDASKAPIPESHRALFSWCERFVRDLDGVAAELELTPEQATALKTLKTDNVVALGGHGILTLLTMLTIQLSAKEAGVVIDSVV